MTEVPAGRVVPVTGADVQPLRRLVLRPGQEPAECAFPGDDAPGTLHIGAFAGTELVAVASVMLEPPPGSATTTAWRLRGMATLPAFRGTGLGAALLDRCIAHAAERGGTVLWCNARIGAERFYRRAGLRAEGSAFELPGIGWHRFMWRPLTPPPTGA